MTKIIFELGIIIVLLCAAINQSLADERQNLHIFVLKEIERVKAEKPSEERTEISKEIFETMNSNKNYQGFDENIVDGLIDLLRDNDDWVRLWTAASLGVLGPRANRAVPSLERALRERECVQQDMSSTSTISKALERITGHLELPNWERCVLSDKKRG